MKKVIISNLRQEFIFMVFLVVQNLQLDFEAGLIIVKEKNLTLAKDRGWSLF